MRINDDSICHNCKHFDHECNAWGDAMDYGCSEYCYKGVDAFYNFEKEVKECEHFEKDKN